MEVAQRNVQVAKETLDLTRQRVPCECSRQNGTGSITGIPGGGGTFRSRAPGIFQADSSSVELHANELYATILRTTFLCGVTGDRVRLAIPF